MSRQEIKTDERNWKTKFLDFPEIPNSKRWRLNPPNTLEQEIIQKLILQQPINANEEAELNEAISYYREVINKLKSFSIAELSIEDLETFKDYYFYVFNHTVLVKNDLWVNNVVRLVKNESVTGKKDKIRESRYLSYPPIEIVNKLGYYNRANTPKFNLFYGADCIDTVLNELKPEVGDVVSVGIWENKDKSTPLISYPINHNPLAIKVNPDTRKGFMAFQNIKQKNHPLLMEFMESIFDFISDEFAKPVINHFDYFYSASFVERLLSKTNEEQWKYDCVAYPSVGNKYSVDNLAIQPDTIDNRFKLQKVIQFEVTETYYEKSPPRTSQEEITLVQYKNLEETDWIEDNGDIVW